VVLRSSSLATRRSSRARAAAEAASHASRSSDSPSPGRSRRRPRSRPGRPRAYPRHPAARRRHGGGGWRRRPGPDAAPPGWWSNGGSWTRSGRRSQACAPTCAAAAPPATAGRPAPSRALKKHRCTALADLASGLIQLREVDEGCERASQIAHPRCGAASWRQHRPHPHARAPASPFAPEPSRSPAQRAARSRRLVELCQVGAGDRPVRCGQQGVGLAGGPGVGPPGVSGLGGGVDVLQPHLAASHRLAILGAGDHDLPQLLGAALLDRLGHHL
jgi:hypothetical protein